MKISATIITLNEQDNIERCINSLQDVADEIVVVDSFSSDNTEQICARYNIKFVKQQFSGYARQKNTASSLASNDYILNIDADEYLSEELRQTILKLKQDPSPHSCYTLKRINNFWGHWIRTCGLYPDKQLRLFDRQKGKFDGLYVHESVVMKDCAKPLTLKGDLCHLTYANPEQMKVQLRKYASLKAKEYAGRKKLGRPVIIFKTIWKFFRDYILLRGFTDGKTGLTICRYYARYEYDKYNIAKKIKEESL